MSEWLSAKARQVFAALLRIGWSIKIAKLTGLRSEDL
jgi:hypothetical protein